MQKKYYWLKLPISFFSDPRIKKLRRIAGGDTYVIIFLKIMLTVINSEGIYTYEGIEKTLEEELALKLDEDVDNIKVVIAFLSTNQEFIELTNENYLIQRVTSLIGKETDSAIRKRRQRQKEKESNVE
ncbi:phage replisome organizer N-terminal domain-containing protein [Sulfurospirillum sp. UCH001]|uniref:phage replisome organizer N-terminal domain-containing protein n=1 Tax=Sulfurospirillum sp. UCH001 TaxID=1581011 RepID=UPI0008330801|nr:phage replisome organizer N-terminal domain-containing protein [Sulfurospirillum sp. UCH001]